MGQGEIIRLWRDKVSDHSGKRSGILEEILGDGWLFIKWVNPEGCRESLATRSGEETRNPGFSYIFGQFSHQFLKPRVLVSLLSLQYLFYS